MGYWRTAMGAVSLASFFDELEEWAGSLRNWKPIAELDGASTSIKSGGGEVGNEFHHHQIYWSYLLCWCTYIYAVHKLLSTYFYYWFFGRLQQ